MKTCEICGEKNFDTAKACTRCKTPFTDRNEPIPTIDPQSFNPPPYYATQRTVERRGSDLSLPVKIFMLITTCSSALALLITLIGWFIALALPQYAVPDEFKIAMWFVMIMMLAIFLVPLFMTMHYFKTVGSGKKIGVAFKICTLLFVNLIAGVIMLCDEYN